MNVNFIIRIYVYVQLHTNFILQIPSLLYISSTGAYDFRKKNCFCSFLLYFESFAFCEEMVSNIKKWQKKKKSFRRLREKEVLYFFFFEEELIFLLDSADLFSLTKKCHSLAAKDIYMS